MVTKKNFKYVEFARQTYSESPTIWSERVNQVFCTSQQKRRAEKRPKPKREENKTPIKRSGGKKRRGNKKGWNPAWYNCSSAAESQINVIMSRRAKSSQGSNCPYFIIKIVFVFQGRVFCNCCWKAIHNYCCGHACLLEDSLYYVDAHCVLHCFSLKGAYGTTYDLSCLYAIAVINSVSNLGIIDYWLLFNPVIHWPNAHVHSCIWVSMPCLCPAAKYGKNNPF